MKLSEVIMLSGGAAANWQPWKTATHEGVDYASYGGDYLEGKCQTTFGYDWGDVDAPAEIVDALAYPDGIHACARTGSLVNTDLFKGKVPYCDLVALGLQVTGHQLADGSLEKYNLLNCENSNWNYKTGQLRLKPDGQGGYLEASCQVKCKVDKGWSGYGANTRSSSIVCKPVYDSEGNIMGAEAHHPDGFDYYQKMCAFGCPDWQLEEILGYSAYAVKSDTCGGNDLHKRKYFQPGSECQLGCQDSSNNDAVTANTYRCRCTDGTGNNEYRVCDWAVKQGSKWNSVEKADSDIIGECKFDECANDDDNCDAHATCTDEDSGFSCACNSGWNGSGTECNDTDECDGENSCSADATCDNTAGSYFCTCKNGFTGDGQSCEDDNECDLGTDNCSPDATCTNNHGGWDCACNAGYSGNGVACGDINECEDGTDTCDDNATCTNTIGGYGCDCNPGFEGDGETCGDIDECTEGTDDCDANAECSNTVGGFDCDCNSGYSGSGQECEDVDECDVGTDTCDDNAICTNTVGAYDCTCKGGFEGDGESCSDINECDLGTDNCDALATCTNSIGGYSCACNSGYDGSGFDGDCADINECTAETDECVADSTCDNTIGGHDCNCNEGFEGEGKTVCQDINECTSNPCDENASCDNTHGSFTCTCNEGWYGDGFGCKDIDECALGQDECDENATCRNTLFRGGYDCDCNSGWEGDGFTCTNVNECLNADLNDCDANADCTDNDGGYTCACKDGFDGDGFTCGDINECTAETDNCNGNAQCANNVGSFTCTCNSGFTGDGVDCQDIDECLTQTDSCDDNAGCTNFAGGYNCACNSGFTGNGYSCEDINECDFNDGNCVADSTCNNIDGSHECNCDAGYSGDGFVACNDVNECELNEDDCDANAKCTNTVGAFDCACNNGFRGDGKSCVDINECEEESDECGANSSCSNNIGGYDCPCNSGYEDVDGSCQDVDECAAEVSPCHELAECTNTVGAFDCKCALGFSGDGFSSCSVCPSDACWTYDEEARTCTRNNACSGLTCGAESMSIEFDAALFGIEEDMEIVWAATASPVWDSDSNRYVLSLGLGAGEDAGIQFTINEKTNEITFSVLVAVDGSGRSRTSSVNKQVAVGGGKSIITAPFGIGVYFKCTYSTEISLTSDPFAYFEVGMKGGYEGDGSLTNGFSMKLNDDSEDTLTLGAFMPVEINWAITTLTGLRFYTVGCSVEHGDTSVDIIKNGCYAGAVEAKPTDSTATSQSFRYKIFKAQNEDSHSQTVNCVIKLCAAGACTWPVADDCSAEGDDALYAYSAYDVSA